MNILSNSIEHAIPLEYVDLSGNKSSPWGVYCVIIEHCCVNNFTLCGDEGMKEYTKEIIDNLQLNTVLQSLTLCKIGRTGLQSMKAVQEEAVQEAILCFAYFRLIENGLYGKVKKMSIQN